MSFLQQVRPSVYKTKEQNCVFKKLFVKTSLRTNAEGKKSIKHGQYERDLLL